MSRKEQLLQALAAEFEMTTFEVVNEFETELTTFFIVERFINGESWGLKVFKVGLKVIEEVREWETLAWVK